MISHWWIVLVTLFVAGIDCGPLSMLVSSPIARSMRMRGNYLWMTSQRFSQVASENRPSNSTATVQSILICGPSGVGKGTIISRLLSEFPHKVALSVSRTSRSPRKGEINGVHYHFVSRDELAKDIAEGSIPYLESAEVHGNLYGTRLDAVHAVHQQGKVCLLDVDVRGAQQLQSAGFPMYSVFIMPPSIDTLEKRLLQRGSETPAQRQLRLHNAREEIAFGQQPGKFDMILVNDDVDAAVRRLLQQLHHWFPTFM